MGADFGGADGAFEDAGDFREREFLETAEEQDLAVAMVEMRERGVDQGVIVALLGVGTGVGAIVGVVVEIDRIGGVRGGVGFAEVVGGAATREVIHPGGKAALVTVSVPVFEHPLEYDLGDILGGGAVAGKLDQETEERAVVAFEELAERVELTVAHGEHQSVIGNGSVGVHGGDGVVWAAVNREGRRIDRNFWSGDEHGKKWTEAAWRLLQGETRRPWIGYKKMRTELPVRARAVPWRHEPP